MPSTQTLFLWLICLLGVTVTHHPTLTSGFAQMQPEAGDCILNNYFLEHTYRWAFDSGYKYGFWSPGFYYPTPYTFTYSETLIGTAPLYWLLRVGFNESVSCQIWLLVLLVLNFWSMAIVLRWAGVNPVLRAAGAYIFAFGLLRTSHLTHQQLMPQFFSPFAVWYAWAFLREPSPRRWALLVGLTAWQFLASIHLGWFLGFGLGIFAIWVLIVERGSRSRMIAFARQRPMAIALPILIGASVIGLYARTFYQAAPERREYFQAAGYAPYIDGWFVALPGSFWADHQTPRHVDNFSEKLLFQGLGIYLVMGIGGWYALRNRFETRSLALCGVGTAVVLFLLVTRWGYNLTLWYFVHSIIPGANAFRAVGRIAYAVYLFGMIGGLPGCQAFVENRFQSARRRTWIYVGILGVVVCEQLIPKPEQFTKSEQGYGQAEALVEHMRGADAAFVVYDDSMPDYRHHIVAMWAGMWADVPVINGFSGSQPKNFPGFKDQPTLEELIRVLGPGWSGKLVIIEWGPPIRHRGYEVRDGRAMLVSD